MTIGFRHSNNPQEFREKVFPFLKKHECENNLNIGIVNNLIESNVFSAFHLFYAEDEKKEVVFVAVWTPPFELSLSEFENKDAEFQQEVLKSFVSFLRTDAASPLHGDGYSTLPGCIGSKQAAKIFTDEWTQAVAECSNVEAKIGMNERIYSVQPHQLKLQPCNNEEDYKLVTLSVPAYKQHAGLRKLLLDYWIEFENEVGLDDVQPTLEERRTQAAKFLEVRLRNKLLFLVVKQQDAASFTGEEKGATIDLEQAIVSLVGVAAAGNTPRVGPVYTPAAHRKNGFASFGVSRVCDELLNKRKTASAVSLYTDLSYATSNKIYMNMGFEALADVDMYKFEYTNKQNA